MKLFWKLQEEGQILTPLQGNPTQKLTRLSLLSTIALTIFMVEAQIPVPIPIPGVKLGLANIVTVYGMFALSPMDTLLILLVRIFLGSVFSGQMMIFFYSLGGGLCCWLSLYLCRRLFTIKELWLCSPLSAIFHNIGQLLVAALFLKSWSVFAYLPYLLLSGILTGLFTGICTQFLLQRLSHIQTEKN